MDGNQTVKFEPNPLSRPISAETANAVTDLMIATVSGVSLDAVASLPGYLVAGKTGTAEQGGEDAKPHAWLTAFAPAHDPEVIVTVLAEASGEGSQVAAPITKKILEAWFGSK